LLPTLHPYLNRVYKILFFEKGHFHEATPYEIIDKTGLSMEDIILCLDRSDPDYVADQDGRPVNVYNVGGFFVGYILTTRAQEIYTRYGNIFNPKKDKKKKR